MPQLTYPSPTPAAAPIALAVELEQLAEAELRLLSRAVGEHLPIELADQVLALRVRRARLQGAL